MTKIKDLWKNFVKSFKKIGKDTGKDKGFRKKIIIYILIGLGVVIVAAIITFGIGLYKYDWDNKPTKWAQKIIPYPAVVGEIGWITMNNYHEQLDIVEHFYQQSKQQTPKGYKKQVLDQLIEQKILERESRKNNVSVTNDEVEEQYQQLLLEQGGEEQVKKILADLWGMTVGEFKDLIEDQLLRSKMEQEIPIRVRVRHILTKIPQDATAAETSALLKKTQKEKEKIVSGDAEFAKEAKRFSEDEATKNQGGDLGWIAFGQTNIGKKCSQKMFSMNSGQIDICKSVSGYHIIKIVDKKGRVEMSFAAWIKEKKNDAWIWNVIKPE